MRIVVKVRTSSSIESINRQEDGTYVVSVRANRKKGKANRELLKILKKYFKSQPRIISGHTSILKIIEIEEN